MPGRPLLSKIVSVVVTILFAATEMCMAAPKSQRVSDSPSPRFEALPLTRSRQNHLLVRAFINGKPALLGVDSGAPISAIALKRRAHFGLTGIPGSSTLPARLQINGAFNNVAPARLMVDTGAFATLLNRGFLRRLHVPLQETPFSSSAVNLKQRGVQIARIKRLSVGSVDIVGKDIGVVDLEGLIHSDLLRGSQPVAGLLGAEILRSHHGIIDFGTRTLYLKN